MVCHDEEDGRGLVGGGSPELASDARWRTGTLWHRGSASTGRQRSGFQVGEEHKGTRKTNANAVRVGEASKVGLAEGGTMRLWSAVGKLRILALSLLELTWEEVRRCLGFLATFQKQGTSTSSP